MMRAKVTAPFDGVPDGEVMPQSFAVGDIVTGDLAETAVKHSQAEDLDAEAAGYDAMTVKELQRLAAERGVELGDAKKKADIIAALELADEAAAETPAEADPAETDPPAA